MERLDGNRSRAFDRPPGRYGRGRDRAAETEQPIGSRYNSEFGSWLARHHFDNIDKGDRSRLIEVIDNLPAIEAWRATLTQTACLRLDHPSSILRKWKAATKVKEPQPTLRDIVADLSEDNAKLKREVEELRARLDEAEATAKMPPRGRDGRLR